MAAPALASLPSAALRVLRRIDAECRTREEAEHVADVLAGFLPPGVSYRVGVLELLLNAIEHGNLEIGGAHKGALLRAQRFDAEIADRLAREPYRSRRVRASLILTTDALVLEIRDDGPGFAWREALAAELAINDQPNGRGIALTRCTCFPGLSYRDPGNVAVVTLPCPS